MVSCRTLGLLLCVAEQQKIFLCWEISRLSISTKETNKIRGGLKIGQDACFITTSLYYREPKPELFECFQIGTDEPHIIPIKRGDKVVMNVFCFGNLRTYKKEFAIVMGWRKTGRKRKQAALLSILIFCTYSILGLRYGFPLF